MKIINENLFEFKKGLDPIDSLGLGRRALIEEWIDTHLNGDITEPKFTYTINSDYTIDTHDYVYFEDYELDYFPEFIQFGLVFNNFYVSNVGLKSFRGFPKYVKENFYCSDNLILSLDGMPKRVDGIVDMRNNSKFFSEQQIRKICKVKGKVYV